MREKPLFPQASLMDVIRALKFSKRRMTVVVVEDEQRNQLRANAAQHYSRDGAPLLQRISGELEQSAQSLWRGWRQCHYRSQSKGYFPRHTAQKTLLQNDPHKCTVKYERPAH